MKKFEIGGVFNTAGEFSSEGALAGPGKRKKKKKKCRKSGFGCGSNAVKNRKKSRRKLKRSGFIKP